MKNFRYARWLLLPMILIAAISCAKRIYQVAYPTLSDGRYDSEFPYKNCSSELEALSATVTKVICTTSYQKYYFPLDRKVQLAAPRKRPFELATKSIELRNTVSGTATIIYSQDRRVALLTCAHVVSKPDTIIGYHRREDNSSPQYVQSIAVKRSQQILGFGLPEDGVLEILLLDDENDIAILSKEFKALPERALPVLSYPLGKARELQWGSFVYLLGYPLGYKVITKGIVSQPDRDRKGSFVIDALFNRGLSGGILLAVRDGVPNFEVVGITASAAAETETVLVPAKDRDYDDALPYEGEIYVENRKTISYGITKAISAEAILSLLQKHREALVKQGYDFKF